MSKKKEKKVTLAKELDHMQNALSRSEAFVERNKKTLSIILLIIVILVLIGLFVKTRFSARNDEAKNAIFRAEQYFQKDSFQLALNGDGENLGFLDVAQKYKWTKTADLAKAYAGVCYKNLGESNKAISYLKEFDASDISLTPALKGAIGDCYLDMGETDKAISFYEKAADADTEVIAAYYTWWLGLAYYSAKNYDKAVTTFEELKTKYPNSQQAMEIDKYIELARAAK